jgi:hypothetical protein
VERAASPGRCGRNLTSRAQADSGGGFIAIGEPGEGLEIIVGFPQAAVDGGLGVEIERNTSRLRRRALSFRSTASSHEHEISV